MTSIVVHDQAGPRYLVGRRKRRRRFHAGPQAADAVLRRVNERAVEEALQIPGERGRRRHRKRSVLTAKRHQAIRRRCRGCRQRPSRGSDVIKPGGLWRALRLIEGTERSDRRQRIDRVGGAVPYRRRPAAAHPAQSRRRRQGPPASVRPMRAVFTLEEPRCRDVSVVRKCSEPRFPSFKGIMAAKKEVTVLTLAEIGVESDEWGLARGSLCGLTVRAGVEASRRRRSAMEVAGCGEANAVRITVREPAVAGDRQADRRRPLWWPVAVVIGSAEDFQRGRAPGDSLGAAVGSRATSRPATTRAGSRSAQPAKTVSPQRLGISGRSAPALACRRQDIVAVNRTKEARSLRSPTTRWWGDLFRSLRS